MATFFTPSKSKAERWKRIIVQHGWVATVRSVGTGSNREYAVATHLDRATASRIIRMGLVRER